MRHGNLSTVVGPGIPPDAPKGGLAGSLNAHRRFRKKKLKRSDKLWPVIIWHQIRTGPFLAIHVDARTSEEAILGMLEDGDPG